MKVKKREISSTGKLHARYDCYCEPAMKLDCQNTQFHSFVFRKYILVSTYTDYLVRKCVFCTSYLVLLRVVRFSLK